MKNKKKKFTFNMNKMLLMFALIPLISATVIISILVLSQSSKEVQKATSNSMLALIEGTGTGFDHYFATSEETLRTFTKAPVVKEFLENPSDAALAAQAQQYTVDFFGALEGWEGIYIADWNSQVLTHPAEPVIGRVMREGDALEELRNSMLASGDVYNTGIITSPASGELIISMYAPIYDGDTPIGYVGAGAFVQSVAQMYTDVSSLNLSTAYTYFVDKNSIMIYHPTPEKIGNPVENSVVKGLVEKMQKGEHPAPECVEYEYKGAMKYAAYYVGVNENYVAVLTADKSDVLATTNKVKKIAIGFAVGLIVLFAVLVFFIAKVVSDPLSKVAKAMLETSEGSLSANTDIHSIVDETKQLVLAAKALQGNLASIIGNVKETSKTVNGSAFTVADMANMSADSCDQVNHTVGELAQGSMSIAESCTQLAGEVDTMSQCCDEITDEVENLSNASMHIQAANDEAKEHMRAALAASEKSTDGANEIADIIMETNARVGEINQAVDLILSIASQTNLLSLNASIEAARAGDAGRGFAVVASEISGLAAQSSESANTIQNIVKRIIEISQKSVERAQGIKQIISDQRDCINETNDKFEALSQQVDSSIESIKAISTKVEALANVKQVINSNVSDLSAISEESAASTQQSTASINSISKSVSDISTNSEELKVLADKLNEQVAFFH